LKEREKEEAGRPKTFQFTTKLFGGKNNEMEGLCRRRKREFQGERTSGKKKEVWGGGFLISGGTDLREGGVRGQGRKLCKRKSTDKAESPLL